jgi:succinylglutamic semialdehyde dehydrogenase
MISKIDISINAYEERCRETVKPLSDAISITRHRPHGVVAVLGPFNFPGYLPLGQIVPALLAGNCVVFKPSELTPKCGEMLVQMIERAEIPPGVLTLVQGGKNTGKLLVEHADIKGVFFVGSWNGGKALAEYFGSHPEKILALEMGGNNPLVVTNIKDNDAAAYLTVQSAFLTSGQRCTCARRLIVPRGDQGDRFIQALIKMMSKINVGPYTQKPDPFMGPVISNQAMEALLNAQQALIAKGAKPLVEMKKWGDKGSFLSPGVIDVTEVAEREDKEFFGPLLQLIRVTDFQAAIAEANNTAFGLTAGLLSDNKSDYEHFLLHVKAGIINWNMPMTGNSSGAPFGGIGKSGNNRPSGFYTVDYCNYPVASLEKPKVTLPAKPTPGIVL